MIPILSTKSPYEIRKIINEANYVFLKQANDKKGVQLCLVMSESLYHTGGFILTTDEEGILANEPFTIPKSEINHQFITKNINEGICTWLELSKLEKFIKNGKREIPKRTTSV